MKKYQIIRFEQNLCNAKLDDNEILFVRVGDVVDNADAKFEVPPTHNALLIKGGGDLRYYKSGTHDVFDDRKEAKQWKKGLSVEVVYIPKDTQVLVKWGTPNRLTYRDEASNHVITIGARGECDISVSNPEQFFRKVVGAKKEFNIMEFKKRYAETIATEFADMFLKVVNDRKLTYDKFDANKKEIAEAMGGLLSAMFEREWGLCVLHFKIAAFDLLDEDKEAIEEFAAEKSRQEKMKEYLAELERLDDKQWEREKYLRQLELEDKAAYYEVLKVIGNRSNVPNLGGELKCPNCGSPYNPSNKFCPKCGKRLSKEPITCPQCGATNDSSSAFCSECGKKLVG